MCRFASAALRDTWDRRKTMIKRSRVQLLAGAFGDDLAALLNMCLLLFYPRRRSRGYRDFTSVCLSFFPHDISKTDAAKITKLNTKMSHHESWKPIYFRAKRSKVTTPQKHCRRVFALLWVLASSISWFAFSFLFLKQNIKIVSSKLVKFCARISSGFTKLLKNIRFFPETPK